MSANGIIGKMTPEELYRASALLKQLEEHPGWAVLTRLVNLEREGVLREITAGLKPLTYERYAHLGGRAHGLWSFRAIVATVHKKAERVRDRIADELGDDGEQDGVTG